MNIPFVHPICPLHTAHPSCPNTARFWFKGQKCGNMGLPCLDKPVLPRGSTMEHMLQAKASPTPQNMTIPRNKPAYFPEHKSTWNYSHNKISQHPPVLVLSSHASYCCMLLPFCMLLYYCLLRLHVSSSSFCPVIHSCSHVCPPSPTPTLHLVNLVLGSTRLSPCSKIRLTASILHNVSAHAVGWQCRSSRHVCEFDAGLFFVWLSVHFCMPNPWKHKVSNPGSVSVSKVHFTPNHLFEKFFPTQSRFVTPNCLPGPVSTYQSFFPSPQVVVCTITWFAL